MQPEWTDERVRSVLVDAYLHAPALPVRSRWATSPVVLLGSVRLELNWEVRFLADDPEAWWAFRIWAWCQATGISVSEKLVDEGRPMARSTFDVRVARAAAAIVAGLNRNEGLNAAGILAYEQSKARLRRTGRLRRRRGRVRKLLLTPGKSALEP